MCESSTVFELHIDDHDAVVRHSSPEELHKPRGNQVPGDALCGGCCGAHAALGLGGGRGATSSVGAGLRAGGYE